MNNEEIQELESLKGKGKLSPKEKARIKALERKAKAETKKESSSPASNVFATKPTTKIAPLPIRFSDGERTGLRTRGDSIKANSAEMVVMELGSLRDINETKLIRAAVHLLKDRTDEEIVQAIKDVRVGMVRGF